MKEPLIDVIVAVYNGAAFIGDAIGSIQAQTLEEINIIVADDGSTDNTVAIVSEIANADNRIKLIQSEHFGVSFALNVAIKKSTAKYIAFLDADDLWHPQKLEKQVKYITENGSEICFCLIQEFQDLNPLNEEARFRARQNQMKGYHKTTFVGQKHVFVKYGLFDETMPFGDFIEWFSRVLRGEKNFIMLEEVLAYRRVHNTNTTGAINRKLYLNVLKSHLDKTRKSDNL